MEKGVTNMKEKKGLIDVPEFNPDEKVAFPPTEPEHRTIPVKEEPAPSAPGKSYAETYTAEWSMPSPSQTIPGAPDICGFGEDMPTEEELKKLSPHWEWKEEPETAEMKRVEGKRLPKPQGAAQSTYTPGEKVAFPPRTPSDEKAPPMPKVEEPAQASPAPPNFHALDTGTITAEELEKLNHNSEWKEAPETSPMRHEKE